MIQNKLKHTTIIIFLLASIIFPQKKTNIQGSAKKLIGKWSTVIQNGERSKTMINFKSDGTVEYDIAAVIQGTYILSRNVLITYFKDPNKSTTEVDTSIVKIEGDTLYQTNIHKGEKILIKSARLDKKSIGSGLIGSWLSENYNGRKTIQEYRKNQELVVDIIVRTIIGTYSVSGNTLTLNLELTPVIKSTFSIKNNEMTIEQIGTKEKKILIKDSN
jgi:hypothetical protein